MGRKDRSSPFSAAYSTGVRSRSNDRRLGKCACPSASDSAEITVRPFLPTTFTVTPATGSPVRPLLREEAEIREQHEAAVHRADLPPRYRVVSLDGKKEESSRTGAAGQVAAQVVRLVVRLARAERRYRDRVRLAGRQVRRVEV